MPSLLDAVKIRSAFDCGELRKLKTDLVTVFLLTSFCRKRRRGCSNFFTSQHQVNSFRRIVESKAEIIRRYFRPRMRSLGRRSRARHFMLRESPFSVVGAAHDILNVAHGFLFDSCFLL